MLAARLNFIGLVGSEGFDRQFELLDRPAINYKSR